MSRLLLFTNDYPYRTGDTVFVEKEIEASCGALRRRRGVLPRAPHRRRHGRPAPVGALRRQPVRVRPPKQPACGARAAHARVARRSLVARTGVGQAPRPSPAVPPWAPGWASRRRTVAWYATRSRATPTPSHMPSGAWAGVSGWRGCRALQSRVVRLHGYDLYEHRAQGGYLPFRRPVVRPRRPRAHDLR